MKILRASSADIPDLAVMNRRLIRDEGYRNPMNVSQLQKRMRGWLKRDYQCWVFKRERKSIGYCLFRDDRDHVYIRQFYVERKVRREGVGSRALTWMMEKVWKRKKLLRLDVLVENARGISFWRSMGFKDYCLTLERKNR